jgi:hypothetical protein
MVYELGELRAEMCKGEEKVVSAIIDKYAHKDSYYLLKYSNWEGQHSSVLRSRYTLQSRKPPIPLIGTKLWLVDNRAGTITLEWDLPMDVKDAHLFSDGEGCKECFHSAQDHGFAVWNS